MSSPDASPPAAPAAAAAAAGVSTASGGFAAFKGSAAGKTPFGSGLSGATPAFGAGKTGTMFGGVVPTAPSSNPFSGGSAPTPPATSLPSAFGKTVPSSSSVSTSSGAFAKSDAPAAAPASSTAFGNTPSVSTSSGAFAKKPDAEAPATASTAAAGSTFAGGFGAPSAAAAKTGAGLGGFGASPAKSSFGASSTTTASGGGSAASATSWGAAAPAKSAPTLTPATTDSKPAAASTGGAAASTGFAGKNFGATPSASSNTASATSFATTAAKPTTAAGAAAPSVLGMSTGGMSARLSTASTSAATVPARAAVARPKSAGAKPATRPRLHVVSDVVGYASTVRVASACIGANTVVAVPLVGRTSQSAEDAEKATAADGAATASAPDAADTKKPSPDDEEAKLAATRAGLAYADQALACYEVTAAAADGDRHRVALLSPIVMRGVTPRSDVDAPRVGPSQRAVSAHGNSRAVALLSDHGCHHTILDVVRNRVIDYHTAAPVRTAAFHPESDELLFCLCVDGRVEVHAVDYASSGPSAATRKFQWVFHDAALSAQPGAGHVETVVDIAVIGASFGTPAVLMAIDRLANVYAADIDLDSIDAMSDDSDATAPLEVHRLLQLHEGGHRATCLGIVNADARAGTFVVVGVTTRGVADFCAVNETALMVALFGRARSVSSSDKASEINALQELDATGSPPAVNPKRKSKKEKVPAVDRTQRPSDMATTRSNKTGTVATVRKEPPPPVRVGSIRLASDAEDVYEATLSPGREGSRNCFIVTLVPVDADSVKSLKVTHAVTSMRRHFLVSVPVFVPTWGTWAYSDGAGFQKFPAASATAAYPDPIVLPLPPALVGFHLVRKPTVGEVPEVDRAAMADMGYDTGAPILCSDSVAFVEAHPGPFQDTHVACTVTTPHYVPLQSIILAATAGPLADGDSAFTMIAPPRVLSAEVVDTAVRKQAKVLLSALHFAHSHLEELAEPVEGDAPTAEFAFVDDVQAAVREGEDALRAILAAFDGARKKVAASDVALSARVTAVEDSFAATHRGIGKAIHDAETSRMYATGTSSIYDLNEHLGTVGRLLDSIEGELDDEEALGAAQVAAADGIRLTIGGGGSSDEES